jgi:predicted nucleic acid-binding protein
VNRGWLLDTSTLSRFAPGRPGISEQIADWMRRQSGRLFMPVIAVAEIEAGICKLRRAGSTTRVEALSLWLDGLVRDYGDRLLDFDTVAARRAGALSDAARANGVNPGFADVAIAAIAAAHDLEILTQNIRHFMPLGVPGHDVFSTLPPELP